MTDYKAIKLMRNGVEYCFPGGGVEVSPTVRLLVVGAGGNAASHYTCYMTGGGGSGGVYLCDIHPVEVGCSYNVVVGAACSGYTIQKSGQSIRGGDSSFGSICVQGGGQGAWGQYGLSYICWGCPSTGGSGGGGVSSINNCTYYFPYSMGCGAVNKSYGGDGGTAYFGLCSYGGAGGGGAGGNGSGFCGFCCYNGYANWCPGDGGKGIHTDIDGTDKWYAGGGAGAGNCGTASNTCRYGTPGCGANYCGGGGTSSWSAIGKGKNGVVIVSYKTDGSNGITCATGGTCYTCGDYTIHCFTSNGTFTIVS